MLSNTVEPSIVCETARLICASSMIAMWIHSSAFGAIQKSCVFPSRKLKREKTFKASICLVV